MIRSHFETVLGQKKKGHRMVKSRNPIDFNGRPVRFRSDSPYYINQHLLTFLAIIFVHDLSKASPINTRPERSENYVFKVNDSVKLLSINHTVAFLLLVQSFF